MGELIETFDVISDGYGSKFLTSLVMGGLLLIGSVLMLFIKMGLKHNYRLLISMLLFFFGIIGLGNAFFTKMTNAKIGSVLLYEKGIEGPDRQIMLSEIQDAYIYADQNNTVLNQNQLPDANRVLVIEYGEEQKYTLQERHYEIESIFQALKTLVNE